MSEVSVILTVLNEGEGIVALLDSLLSQTRTPDEIVVVDGGSSDATLDILRQYADRDSRIRVHVNPGVNIARGRNIAISRTTHQIIAVTDGGCHPAPEWLESLTAPLLADETVGAVAGSFAVEWRTRFEYYSGLLCQPRDFESEKTRLFYGRSSAFRKELWERVGGYPEWLYTAEDTLFALRARQLGYRIAYAPGGLVHWPPRPTLRKLAKMFFLYGRGNGQINVGSIKGSLFWLRYHALLGLSLIAGLVIPAAWLVSLAVMGYLYQIMFFPVLREVRRQTDDLDREIYVPLIVYTRNLSSNLGYLLGRWDRRRNPAFQENLAAYSSPASDRAVNGAP